VPKVIKEEVKEEVKEGNSRRSYATPPHRIRQNVANYSHLFANLGENKTKKSETTSPN